MITLANRIHTTTTTTGTGAVTVSTAALRKLPLSTLADGTVVPYVIEGQGASTEWEMGNGTIGTSGTVLTRTTVVLSSNSNSAVSFSAGTKDVFVVLPAEYVRGMLNITPNDQSANYTAKLTDLGGVIRHPATDANARTFTIDSHANVVWPDGATITFQNWTAAVVTIAITTDTLVWSPAGTTGSRSLAQYGIATATYTLATNKWLISGSGLT
jgi:hypothetical protein